MKYVIRNKSTLVVTATGCSPEAYVDTLEAALADTLELVRVDDFVALPTPDLHKWDEETQAYVSNTPPAIPPTWAVKAQQLRDACETAIVAGFKSSALGSVYSYPSDQIAQLNMLQGGALMCADSSGNWALRDHTDVQSQTVLADFNTYKNSQRTQLATLLASVQAATTQADLDAIVWSSP